MKTFRNSTERPKRGKVSFGQERAFPGKIIWTFREGKVKRQNRIAAKKTALCKEKKYYFFFGCCKNARYLVISDQNASDLEVGSDLTRRTLSRRLRNRFFGDDEWQRGCSCPGPTPDPVQRGPAPEADHLQGQWDRWENHPAAEGNTTFLYS